MDKFSEWLLKQIDERGMKLSELAREAKLGSGTLNHIIAGRRNPGVDVCNAIARVFNLPPEDVLRRADLLPPSPKNGDLPLHLKQAWVILQNLPPDKQKTALLFLRFLQENNHVE